MKLKNYKLSLSLLFACIFTLKMLGLAMPAFISLFTKGDGSIITQLEQEAKADKEDPEKDAFKEKDFLCVYTSLHPHHCLVNDIRVTRYALHQNNLLQLYHPIVPTPPPDSQISL